MPFVSYFTVNNPSAELIDRFFAKVIYDPVTECWVWNGSKIRNGYGSFRCGREVVIAHRFAWAWLVAPLQRGRKNSIPVLDHIVCDNTSCVNPDHLQLVSNTENLRRTNAVGAINARKTVCWRGHPFTGTQKNGKGRRCMVCKRIAAAEYRKRKGIPSWDEWMATRRARPVW